MEKYAKVKDNKTKLCYVGFEDPKETFEEKECDDGKTIIITYEDYYKSCGMTKMDVEQAYNGQWYVKGYAPDPLPPTYEEVDRMRVQYRREHIDDKTTVRSRKMANKTWTDEDEQAYLALDAEVTAYIEEHFPYPEES